MDSGLPSFISPPGQTRPTQSSGLARPESEDHNRDLRAPFLSRPSAAKETPEQRGGGATYGGVGNGDHYFWRPGPPAAVVNDDGSRGRYEDSAAIGASAGLGGFNAGSGAGGGASSAGGPGDFLTGPVVLPPSSALPSSSFARPHQQEIDTQTIDRSNVDAAARGLGGPGAPFDPRLARVYR